MILKRIVFVCLVLCTQVQSSPIDESWEEASPPAMVDAQLRSTAQIQESVAGAIDTFKQYLQSPPVEAVDAAKALESRADQLVASLGNAHKLPSDIDVVVSGGGNLDGYYMGVSLVLQRLRGVSVKRYAGASAGGMMPFEEELMGQHWTLLLHLSF